MIDGVPRLDFTVLGDHEDVVEGEGHGDGALAKGSAVDGWFLPHGHQFLVEIRGFSTDEVEFLEFIHYLLHSILSTWLDN
jgi:hypothetical protein